MMLALLLISQDQAATPFNAEAVVAAYREQTLAQIPCRQPNDDNEIVVCALRDADHYRVPFVTADPMKDTAAARLRRIVYDPVAQGETPCGQGAFTVRCGSVGVTATAGADGRVRAVPRELAP
ncbi:hypothetical protein ACX40Y_02220 [Sphingomonas sp. RS6]